MRLFRSFDSDENKPKISSEPVSKPKPKPKYTFLVVDDSKFSRGILTDILKNEGYTIVGEANDGYEAIDMVKEKSPSFVFMDITMPKMDGLTAVKEILKINPNINIIMCSALSQKRVIVEAIKAGAKDFVIKPYKKENILNVVNVHMEADKKGQVIPFRSENHIKKTKDSRCESEAESDALLLDDEALSREVDLIFDSYAKENEKHQGEQPGQPKFKVVKPEKEELKPISESNSDATKARPGESKNADSLLDEFERFLQTFSSYSSSIVDTDEEAAPESTDDSELLTDEEYPDLVMADLEDIPANDGYKGSYLDEYADFIDEETANDEAPDLMSDETDIGSGDQDEFNASERSPAGEASYTNEPYINDTYATNDTDETFEDKEANPDDTAFSTGSYQELSVDDGQYGEAAPTREGLFTEDVTADEELYTNETWAQAEQYAGKMATGEELEDEKEANPAISADGDVADESQELTELVAPEHGEDGKSDADKDLSIYEASEAAMVEEAAEDQPDMGSNSIPEAAELSDFGLPKKILPDRPVHTYASRFGGNNQLVELNQTRGIKVSRVAATRLIMSNDESKNDLDLDLDLLYSIACAYISPESKPGKDETKWNGHTVHRSIKNISGLALINRQQARSISMLDLIRNDRSDKKHANDEEVLLKAIADLVRKKSERVLSSE